MRCKRSLETMKNHLWTIISLSHFGLQKWLTLIDVGRKLSCFGAKMVIASVTWLAKIQKKKKEICCSMSFAFSLSCLFNEANLKNRRRCLRICRRKSFQLEHGNHHSNVIIFFLVWKHSYVFSITGHFHLCSSKVRDFPSLERFILRVNFSRSSL